MGPGRDSLVQLITTLGNCKDRYDVHRRAHH